MKKVSKIFAIILLVVMLTSFASTVFAATSVNPGTWKNQTGDKIKTDDITNFSASLINVISIIGSAAAIITLIVLGIKYMMGSAEEKAEYKKTMMPYIVGAALIFAASAFAQVIYQFFTGVTTS